MSRLHDKYKADVAPALMKKFSYKSPMQIPKIDKVIINVGCSEARDNAKVLEVTKKVLRDTINHEGDVFGNSEIECGNYRTLNLQKAKDEAQRYLDILESREQSFKYN